MPSMLASTGMLVIGLAALLGPLAIGLPVIWWQRRQLENEILTDLDRFSRADEIPLELYAYYVFTIQRWLLLRARRRL